LRSSIGLRHRSRPVEVKQVERETGGPIRLATIERVWQVADVGHAAVIGRGGLAEHDFSPAGQLVAERFGIAVSDRDRFGKSVSPCCDRRRLRQSDGHHI